MLAFLRRKILTYLKYVQIVEGIKSVLTASQSELFQIAKDKLYSFFLFTFYSDFLFSRVSPFSLSKTEDGNTSPKSNFVITTSPRTKENTALNNSDEPQTTSSTPLPKPLPRILTPSATCHFPSSSSRNPRDSNPRDFSSQNSLEMEGIQTSPRAASPRQLLSTREGTGNFLVRSPRGPVAGENNDIVLKTNSPRKPREDSFRNLKVVMTEKKTSMNLNYAAFPKKGKVGSTKLKEVGPIPSEPVPCMFVFFLLSLITRKLSIIRSLNYSKAKV